jgi:5'-3' exonuclease
MGIHGLTEYLKKNAPDYIQQVDAHALGIRRVALDAHQWMTVATKRVIAAVYEDAADPWAELTPDALDTCRALWLRSALHETCTWLDRGMEPVWVFDGPAPAAKATCKAERAATRARAAERLEELRGATSARRLTAVGTDGWALPASDHDLRKKIVSLRQQLVSLQPGWQEALIAVLTAAGVPWVVGATEGEKVACMLWRAGDVDAVVSTDTDCLVYGCDRVIVSPNALHDPPRIMMSFYARAYILEFLELSDAQFTEFCIACGCDYNTHIPKIGPVKVHDLMRTYTTLGAWPPAYKATPLDTTRLNIDECQRLFAPCDPGDCIASKSASLRMDWARWATCAAACRPWLGDTADTAALFSRCAWVKRP